MSLVEGSVGLIPGWRPTSMRPVRAPGVARVLVTAKMQRDLGAVLAGVVGVAVKYHQALWQTRRGNAMGGSGVRGARDWP